MKPIFFSILFSICVFTFSYAQIPLVKMWDYRYGGLRSDNFTICKLTDTGEFLLGGYSNSGIGGDKTQDTIGSEDYWVVKLDTGGSIIWDKNFGGTKVDQLMTLQQTTDGGCIFGGFSNSSISGDKSQDTIGGKDFWIIKTNGSGIKQWDKTFGG